MSTIIKSTNTELDFDEIKNSLKSYFQSQEKYTDYNFEGSGLSILLDILSYNTHFNALNAHLALNEMHLGSSVVRENVVNHAKTLGYIPNSKSCSRASIKIELTPPPNSLVGHITLPKWTQFSSGSDNNRLIFYTVDDYSSTINDDGIFILNDVIIKEGIKKTIRYIYDSRLPFPRFEIPDKDVDTSTILVRLKDSEYTTNFTTFNSYKGYNNISSDTLVYYLQENSSGKYEIYFGNGRIGKAPENGNIIEIEYIYTNGVKGNGAKTFSLIDTILGSAEVASITTISKASGGSEKESIESIRRNAPLFYESQNRCVTTDDYRVMVLQNFPGIETISAWGGELEDPPKFGKVFLSIKPIGAETISTAEKDYIIDSILANKKIATVGIEILNPEYTYIYASVVFKYNSYNTTLSENELGTLIRNCIIEYNNTHLKKFDGSFRYSKLTNLIDSTDLSILNSSMKLFFYKKFTPFAEKPNTIKIAFPTPLLQIDDDVPTISSSNFVLNGEIVSFSDKKIPGNLGERDLMIVKTTPQGLEIVSPSAGKVIPVSGTIYINGFQPDTPSPITIFARPNSLDIFPSKNQLLTIDDSMVTISGSKDYLNDGRLFNYNSEQTIL